MTGGNADPTTRVVYMAALTALLIGLPLWVWFCQIGVR